MSKATPSQLICLPHLPVELWTEIMLYLPRYILKSLFIFQPHPLGKIASHTYFSRLSLHLGIFRHYERYNEMYTCYWQSNDDKFVEWRDELIKWHNKRSRDILVTIVESDFGNRVQKLRIDAGTEGQTDILASLMELLISALPKLTGLKILECNGPIPFFTAIAGSLVTLPHLKTLRLGECGRHITPPTDEQIHLPPHLNKLTLCEGWDYYFFVDCLPNSLVKNLHVTTHHPEKIVHRIINNPHFMENLTHLSWVFDDAIDSNASSSIFEIALKCIANLKSLQLRGHLGAFRHSQYFRQCIGTLPEVLPYLTEFGIYVTSGHSDPDFFPAVCDFLKPKVVRLVHLELGSPGPTDAQNRLGYDGGRGCWALFKNTLHHHKRSRLFPLESLSMPLPAGKANFGLHFSRLIPSSVTRLSLSGHDLLHNSIYQIFKVSRSKKRGPIWPPNLHLICIHINSFLHDLHSWNWELNLVDLIAESLPTIRVVKITDSHQTVHNFWSIKRADIPESEQVGGVWPNRSQFIRCIQWESREGTVMRNDILERLGCEDTHFADG